MSILAVAAASGVGKSTFMRTFLKAVPNSALLTSYTTRALRGDEIEWHGISEYRQLSPEEMLQEDDAGAYLHLFGRDSYDEDARRYRAFYATRVDEFEAALASPHPHLAALFVPGVELFFDEARKRNQENAMHAIFLDIKNEEVRLRRLGNENNRDASRYEEEVEKWKVAVSRSDAPFFILDTTDSSPETLMHMALNKFGIKVDA